MKLQPEDAFGEYDAELVMIEPRDIFPENIEVGMQFERAAEEGDEDELYTITDIADDKVVVDGNHPLAGMALSFPARWPTCGLPRRMKSATATFTRPARITIIRPTRRVG